MPDSPSTFELIPDRHGHTIGAIYQRRIKAQQAPGFEGNFFEADGQLSAIFHVARDAQPFVTAEHARLKTDAAARDALRKLGVPSDIIGKALHNPGARLYRDIAAWKSNNLLRFNHQVPTPTRLETI